MQNKYKQTSKQFNASFLSKYNTIGFPGEFRHFVMQFPICSIQFRQICVGIEISSFNFVFGHSNVLTEQPILHNYRSFPFKRYALIFGNGHSNSSPSDSGVILVIQIHTWASKFLISALNLTFVRCELKVS